MMPFTKCPICGSELEVKEVEKIVRGGKLYAEETVRYFETIRHKLRRQENNDFQVLGNSFIVSNDLPQRAL